MANTTRKLEKQAVAMANDMDKLAQFLEYAERNVARAHAEATSFRRTDDEEYRKTIVYAIENFWSVDEQRKILEVYVTPA